MTSSGTHSAVSTQDAGGDRGYENRVTVLLINGDLGGTRDVQLHRRTVRPSQYQFL
jgi:hypothetical protein